MNNNAPIRKLPTNSQGKDYVVGDLHGCYSLLERLLDAVHFDKSRDRLFSVGDLIDRGPDSLRCLELLAEPWFYAVQGNHEIMMLDFFLPYLLSGKMDRLKDVTGTGFLNYGGDWVEGYFDAEKQSMSVEFNRALTMVLDMPQILIVGDGKKRFHVIHAELIRPDHRATGQAVWLDSDIDRWLAEQTLTPEIEDRLYWGRTLMTGKLAYGNAPRLQFGLSTTFCGHTYATTPRQVLSHLCLDTGAFVTHKPELYNEDDESYALTLFDIQASCWVSASYQREELLWGEHPVNVSDR